MKNPLLAVKMKASGLKCDAPDCNFKSEAVLLTKDVIEETIGTPCPVCGENLLTQKDATTLLFVMNAVRWINVLAFPFMFLILPFTLLWKLCGKKDPVYKVDMNGTGEMTISKKSTTK